MLAKRYFLLLATCLSAPIASAAEPLVPPREAIDLSGPWRFALDRRDVGVREKWFLDELEDSVRLPGSLQAQGKGDDPAVDSPWTGEIVDRSWFAEERYAKYRVPGSVKVPFWLQADKYYVGPAWYQRDVEIPASWRGKRILLSLERCHWETRVWVGGQEARSAGADSLSTPHVYDLTGLAPPPMRKLTLRVDNRVRIGVGLNAHSVSDHTQTNWNGIIGEVKLSATDRVWIDGMQAFPDVKDRKARVAVRVSNATGDHARGRLVLAATSYNAATSHAPESVTVPFEVPEEGGTVEAELPLEPGALLWDEFSPALYRLEVTLLSESPRARDLATTTFGLREIGTEGTQFTLNGRRIFLRGALECCIFPLTGYPPTDVESWKKVLHAAKAHGLNHLRFHSWCPPEAAFQAADELGVYYYVECPAWANSDSSIGDGKPIDRWIYTEGDRILERYGNHPSFVLMSYGNEPGGPNQGRYLADLVRYWRKKDPRRLYTSGAGWPELAENQFHVTPAPRIQQWGQGLGSRINASPPETVTDYRDFIAARKVPVVSHEIGQWCVYPNFDEIVKYTGVLKAKNFEIFRDGLETKGMGDRARDFLMASGKLQAICYKEEIESALRTPGMGGFELLDLHDFPGQGTALVGVLDPFWESKGYITAAEYSRFCGSVVILARMRKRILTEEETFSAAVEVANFGPGPIHGAVASWALAGSGAGTFASGELPARDLPVGSLTPLGKVEVPLRGLPVPGKFALRCSLEGTTVENDWSVWVYPSRVDTSASEGILLTAALDDAARSRLQAGGKVLLLAPPQAVRTSVAIGFSSIFWNTAWTRNQPPHTLGILCDPKHAALSDFPTDFHSDWQWWELVSRSAAMVLDDVRVVDAQGSALPGARLKPIVGAIDTWFENRRLGLLLEARVLGGKLLMTSIDLRNDLGSRPVARQLLNSILRYMGSPRFDPSFAVSTDSVASLLKAPSRLERLGARVLRADSEAEGLSALRAIDGDPTTIWHTPWEPRIAPMPHCLILELGKAESLRGITYLPRQDMSNGRIAKYAVYVSNLPDRWEEPVATGTWPNTGDVQTVLFERQVTGKYVKIEAISEVQGRSFTSVSEIDLLTD